MTILERITAIWHEDNLLRRVVKNSSHVMSGNVISSALMFLQGIIAVRMVGFASWGIIGIIQTFSSNVNRLLSFRMSEVVVKDLSPYLAEGRKREAAALVKAAGAVEAVTSVVAFAVLGVLASFAARVVAKNEQMAPWFIFYGLTLLSMLVFETSSGVLQATHQFKHLARLNIVQSIITASTIFAVFIASRFLGEPLVPYLLPGLLLAYVLGKAYNGIGAAVLAGRTLNRELGKGWWQVPLQELPNKKTRAAFALNTNLYGTLKIAFQDNIELYLGYLLSPVFVGYYKLAKSFVSYMGQIIDPLIMPTYSEIARTVATQQWKTTLRLLRRVSLITGTVVLGIFAFSALAGWWVIPLVWSEAARPVYPLLLILLVGYGFAGVFQWNRSLLLSLGEAGFPVIVTAATGLVELVLIFTLARGMGYLALGTILSGYFIVSIGVTVVKGLAEVRRRQKLMAQAGIPEPVYETQPPVIIPEAVPARRQQLSWQKLKLSFLRPGLNYWDWLFASIFLVFGAWYFLGRLQANYPIVILSGDGGNIASYAAAQDHPGWFALDPALGSANNTGIYATIHIPLIRLLYRFTHDYGQAFAWLVLPETFLQLLGFYILGRVLFKNRFWAFLLAFLTAMMVINLGLGEIWGVWRDALPRVTFQSLLPFLLALTLHWKDKPSRWFWLMVFAGLLVYVHPISAPAWGFAIWLSLWFLLPKDLTWRRRILLMLGLGVLFLLVMAPYVVIYLSYNSRGQSADYNTVMTVLNEFSPQNLLQPLNAMLFFLWDATRRLLLPVALLGFIATWILKKGDRKNVKTILWWMAGILITSILIPFFEQVIEQRLHILPLETELVRGFRYFVPLLLIFWLYPLAELLPRLAGWKARSAVVALGLVLFAFWGATNRPDLSAMLRAVTCLSRGQLVCTSARPIDAVLHALSTGTQPGEGVLFFSQDPVNTSRTLSVRYAALRPLVYTERDNGILSYANRSALPAWLATTRKWQALRALPDPLQRLDGLVTLAEDLHARYLVIDFPIPPEAASSLQPSILMQNAEFTLFKLP